MEKLNLHGPASVVFDVSVDQDGLAGHVALVVGRGVRRDGPAGRKTTFARDLHLLFADDLLLQTRMQ